MVWSEQIGASLIVPGDARPDDPTDTRDYIVLGEDVPDEIASAMTAGLVFHNKSGNTDGVNGNEPLYWAFGITKAGGHLEMIAYYNVGNPTFGYQPATIFSLGMRGTPSITLGGEGGAFPNVGASAFAETMTVTQQLQVTNTRDVGAKNVSTDTTAVTDGGFIVGDSSALHLTMDNNEIASVNGATGIAGTLGLFKPISGSPQQTSASSLVRYDFVTGLAASVTIVSFGTGWQAWNDNIYKNLMFMLTQDGMVHVSGVVRYNAAAGATLKICTISGVYLPFNSGSATDGVWHIINGAVSDQPRVFTIQSDGLYLRGALPTAANQYASVNGYYPSTSAAL